MSTNEIKEENVKTLVKLGIDVEDLAKVYLKITNKNQEISKEKYIDKLTKILKFFQTRNNGLNEDENAIYKDDVLKMLTKNKNIINLDINKKIKIICDKLDSYYFMNKQETNKLIKQNPNIFNVNLIDLETYSCILSNFAIQIDNNIVNLFEYILKKQSELLNQNVNIIYARLRFLEKHKKTKKMTKEEISNIGNAKFIVDQKEIRDEEIKEYDNLPKYNKEDIRDYKEKIKLAIEN